MVADKKALLCKGGAPADTKQKGSPSNGSCRRSFIQLKRPPCAKGAVSAQRRLGDCNSIISQDLQISSMCKQSLRLAFSDPPLFTGGGLCCAADPHMGVFNIGIQVLPLPNKPLYDKSFTMPINSGRDVALSMIAYTKGLFKLTAVPGPRKYISTSVAAAALVPRSSTEIYVL